MDKELFGRSWKWPEEAAASDDARAGAQTQPETAAAPQGQTAGPDGLTKAREEASREAKRYDALPRRGHEQMEEYLKYEYTLAPEVRAMLAYDLPSHWGSRLVANVNYLSRRMRWVFAQCGHSGETLDLNKLRQDDWTTYPDDYAEYVERYRDQAGALWTQYQAEKRTLQNILALCKAEEEEEKAFWQHFQALPQQTRAYLTYELARRGALGAGDRGGALGVFGFFGFLDDGQTSGVAFRIWRDCFAGRDPLLFYAYDQPVGCDTPWREDVPDDPSCQFLAEKEKAVEAHSSGIRLEGRHGRIFLFRLDASRLRALPALRRPVQGTACTAEYVFAWPGAGEFDCTLGEVVDGKLLPLYRNDFFMK